MGIAIHREDQIHQSRAVRLSLTSPGMWSGRHSPGVAGGEFWIRMSDLGWEQFGDANLAAGRMSSRTGRAASTPYGKVKPEPRPRTPRAAGVSGLPGADHRRERRRECGPQQHHHEDPPHTVGLPYPPDDWFNQSAAGASGSGVPGQQMPCPGTEVRAGQHRIVGQDP